MIDDVEALVRELRELHKRGPLPMEGGGYHWQGFAIQIGDLAIRAADEIERLRAEVERLRGTSLPTGERTDHERIDRLEHALLQLADIEWSHASRSISIDEIAIQYDGPLGEIAREASLRAEEEK